MIAKESPSLIAHVPCNTTLYVDVMVKRMEMPVPLRVQVLKNGRRVNALNLPVQIALNDVEGVWHATKSNPHIVTHRIPGEQFLFPDGF